MFDVWRGPSSKEKGLGWHRPLVDGEKGHEKVNKVL